MAVLVTSTQHQLTSLYTCSAITIWLYWSPAHKSLHLLSHYYMVCLNLLDHVEGLSYNIVEFP